LPRARQGLVLSLIGALAGTVLWILYLYLMIHSRNPVVYVLFGLVGAACGVALVRIPTLIWDFLRKQGYQILLRQWTDRSRVLAHAARKALREADEPLDSFGLNDMAVVDFLQANHAGAVTGFEQAAAQGVEEAPGNLLAALAEAGDWDRLTGLLQGDRQLETLPDESNLARLSARVPDEELLQRLWTLAQERGQALVLNNLGARAMRRGQYDEAASALEQATHVRPGYAYAHANLGVLAYRQGDLAHAVSEAASAAGLVEDEIICANLGALLALAGDLRNAEKWLDKAHKLQPREAAVLLNRGAVYSLSGRPDDAVRALHDAAAQPAHAATAHYNLGLHCHRQQNSTPALEQFDQAVALDPEDPDVLNNIGCIYFQQGKYADAYAHFAQVAALGGGAYRRNVIRAELAARRFNEAEELLKEAEAQEGLSLELGLVYLLRAMSIKPETKTHQQMIEFNVNAAAAEFTQVIAAGGGGPEASLNYGCAQYLRGEHLAAAETFAANLRKGTLYPEMSYLTGICYLMAGMRELDQHEVKDDKVPGPVRELFLKARAHLEKAIEVPSVHESASYDLGLLDYMLGDYQKAIDVLRKIARQDSAVHVVNTLALAMAKLAQDMQLTAQTATLMAETRKKETRTQARQLLGAAIHYFTQALRLEPQAPMLHANMGLALMLRNHTGDVESALQHWQLMHQHGDAAARRTYEQFMQVMSAEAAAKLRFQDVELTFRPVDIHDWVRFPQPQMSGFKYVVRDVLDEPEWQLQARHKLVRRALIYRSKAERIRRKLKRLAI
jgi:tetratricopeptide (TPR) repeat protein